MNQNKFTFELQNLVLYYSTFKFQRLEDSTKIKIGNYLFKFGFNSYQEAGKLIKPIKEFNLFLSILKINLKFVLLERTLIRMALYFTFLDPIN